MFGFRVQAAAIYQQRSQSLRGALLPPAVVQVLDAIVGLSGAKTSIPACFTTLHSCRTTETDGRVGRAAGSSTGRGRRCRAERTRTKRSTEGSCRQLGRSVVRVSDGHPERYRAQIGRSPKRRRILPLPLRRRQQQRRRWRADGDASDRVGTDRSSGGREAREAPTTHRRRRRRQGGIRAVRSTADDRCG